MSRHRRISKQVQSSRRGGKHDGGNDGRRVLTFLCCQSKRFNSVIFCYSILLHTFFTTTYNGQPRKRQKNYLVLSTTAKVGFQLNKNLCRMRTIDHTRTHIHTEIAYSLPVWNQHIVYSYCSISVDNATINYERIRIFIYLSALFD